MTAGPTLEPIDAVRYISNHSSGKQGFEIAKQSECEVTGVTLSRNQYEYCKKKAKELNKKIKIFHYLLK